tara:strand:- start:38 stop:211 length:174 start_codon:yes stop_codon:yes gene_type:complete
MKLTFDNGYEVSIMGKNEYVLTPEVGYWRNDDDEPMQVISFESAEELMHILIQIETL